MAAMGGGEGRAKAGGMVGGQEKRRGVAPRSTSPGPAADLQPGALTRSPQRPSPLSPAPSSQVRRCGPSAIAHHARPAAHCFPSTNRPLPWPLRPALSPVRLMPGSSFVPACPLSPPPPLGPASARSPKMHSGNAIRLLTGSSSRQLLARALSRGSPAWSLGRPPVVSRPSPVAARRRAG